MNIAIVLAAGVGQRMRNGGLPKQFLKLSGKPIIIYTLEKFEESEEVNEVVVVCHSGYIEYMQNLQEYYHLKKINKIVVGGSNRQSSIQRGLKTILDMGGKENDIVLIHDGVRPLVNLSTIYENIRIANQYGCAITVHSVTESVVITETEQAEITDFKKRKSTYSLTSPQTFRLKEIMNAYKEVDKLYEKRIPLLDAAMVYAQSGGTVHLVKEQGINIKITTPEDYYILKAILEVNENKYIFGL